MRIHIIGGAGSGKTSLAQKVSVRLGIPHFNLDEMFWDDPPSQYGKRRNEEERARLLNEAVEKSDWIIEGVYDKWVFSSFQAANIVIVLRPTLSLRIYRIIKRFIRRKLGLEPRKNEKLSYLIRLIIWSFEYEKEHIPRFLNTLRQNKIRFIECKNSKEAFRALPLE